MRILLAAINAKYIHSNLAIRYLKGYAKRRISSEISLAEYTINQYVDEILAGIYAQKPDILGFSCYLWNIDYVRKLTVLIKKVLPETIIIWGGPEVSYHPSKEFSVPVDFVISGEGEKTFTDLASALESGNVDFSGIKGISYRCGEEIITTPPTCGVDMGELPFPYENFDGLENRIIYYEASRGCPFRCQYCLSSIEKGVRRAPIEKVKQELSVFLERKVPQVKFVDRTFNCDKKFAMEIISFLMEHDNGVTNFHFEVAADLLDDEIIGLLSGARMGLFQLEIGVQSTNEETLSVIQRKTDFGKICDCVEKLKLPQNIHLHLDLIAGLPMEDYESFRKSFNDVHGLLPHQLQLGFLKVLKGSGMESMCAEYGIEYSPYPPYEVLSTHKLSYDEVLKLKGVEEMVEVYYNSGRFSYSTEFLRKQFPPPFDFYDALRLFKKEKHAGSLVSNKQYSYAFLIEFAEKNNLDIEKVKWLLKFDMLLHENMKTNPAWLELEQQEDKERIYNFLVRNERIFELLPEYKGVNIKQLPKLVHAETFPFNPLTLEEKPVTLLFNYRRTDFFGNASIAEVSL